MASSDAWRAPSVVAARDRQFAIPGFFDRESRRLLALKEYLACQT
jgi:hypothetical protein